MESSTNPWFLDLGLDQCDDLMAGLGTDQIFRDDFLLGEDYDNTFAFCIEPTPPLSGSELPAKREKTNAGRDPVILNFGDKSSPESSENVNSGWPLNNPDHAQEMVSQGLSGEGNSAVKDGMQTANKRSRERPPSQTYDHIISERKRRKLLSERFVVLSGMVPGLKKMDKTSVLGEAITYLQNLQERVETLEEKLKNKTVESAVLVRKSRIIVEAEEEGSSNEENSSCCSDEQQQMLPEIEVKVCNNQAILRIHCEKQPGVMIKLLAKLEKLKMTVLSSNVSQFGNLAMYITIMVEMDKEDAVMAAEIVEALHSSLRSSTPVMV